MTSGKMGLTAMACIMPAQLSEKILHIKNHLLFLKGAQIVIVDPRENKAVDIID